MDSLVRWKRRNDKFNDEDTDDVKEVSLVKPLKKVDFVDDDSNAKSMRRMKLRWW